MYYLFRLLFLITLITHCLVSDESFVKEKKKSVVKKNPTESIAHQYGQITKLCADMHEKLAHIEQHSIAKMYKY